MELPALISVGQHKNGEEHNQPGTKGLIKYLVDLLIALPCNLFISYFLKNKKLNRSSGNCTAMYAGFRFGKAKNLKV